MTFQPAFLDTLGHLPREGLAYSGLVPPPSVFFFLIKKMPPNLVSGQSGGAILRIKVPSFQMTLVNVRLAKQN